METPRRDQSEATIFRCVRPRLLVWEENRLVYVVIQRGWGYLAVFGVELGLRLDPAWTK